MPIVDLIPIVVVGLALFASACYLVLEFIRAHKA